MMLHEDHWAAAQLRFDARAPLVGYRRHAQHSKNHPAGSSPTVPMVLVQHRPSDPVERVIATVAQLATVQQDR